MLNFNDNLQRRSIVEAVGNYLGEEGFLESFLVLQNAALELSAICFFRPLRTFSFFYPRSFRMQNMVL